MNEILASERLPSLPGVALKIIELIRNSEAETKEIVCLVRSDPALAAKILRTVNSSLFGMRQPVTTIEQAVTLLGNTCMVGLVLSFTLLPRSTRPGPVATWLQWYWRSSLMQAVAAEELAKLAGGGTPAEFFVAGLLQDVGGLALLRTVPDEYLQVLELFDRCGGKLVELERDRLGLTHIEISIELCRRWRLAPWIQAAIAGHHDNVQSLTQETGTEHAPLMKALATSSAVAAYFCCTKKGWAEVQVREMTERLYNIEGTRLHQFLCQVSERVRETVQMTAVDIGRCPSYDEILAAARAEMVDVSSKALYDPLTIAGKRQEFQDNLIAHYRAVNETGGTISVLLVDLDGFRKLNEEHGIHMGDKAMKSVSKVLNSLAGKFAAVSRFGDDEFAILITALDENTIWETAQEIRRAIACHTVAYRSEEIEITASLGVAYWKPQGTGLDDPGTLLRLAQGAMDRAKACGGNQVQWQFFPGTDSSPGSQVA